MKKTLFLLIIFISAFFANAQSPEFFVKAKAPHKCKSGDCQNGFGIGVWGTGVYTVTYTGNFLNGKPNGIGKYYRIINKFPLSYRYESYEGNWKDGFYDGFGSYKMEYLFKKKESQDSNEIITYVGNWKNGFKEGAGIYFEKLGGFPEYRKYDGNWENDKYDGYGSYSNKFKDEVEESYVGYWKDGWEEGQGVHKEGITREGLFVQGVLIDGKIFEYNGVLICEGKNEIANFNQRNIVELNTRYEKSKEDVERLKLEQARLEQSKIDKTSNNTNGEAKKDCLCDRCGGSGKISFKSFKTREINNGTDKYGNTKTIKLTGYVDEDQTCTRCLGDGKCH